MKGINAVIAVFLLVFTAGCGCVEKEYAKAVASYSGGNYDALDTSGSGWGFVKRKGMSPEIPKKQSDILEKYNGRYIDRSGNKTLYLTFDEGYENGFTAMILDTLAKTHTPAAFFVTGPYLTGQEELIKRMIDEGHIVGNHTVNHLNLPKQTTETVQDEITSLNDACMEMYGYKMEYMRPPEGEFSEKVLAIANDLDMKTVMWSFAYKDWDVNIQNGADHAYGCIMPYLHDGAVILLHAVSSDNAYALERIINDARASGYEFMPIDSLYQNG